jgi:hypothetical protein
MSARQNGSPLWLIYWKGCRVPVLFAGTKAEMHAEIDRRHRLTGIQHSAREV